MPSTSGLPFLPPQASQASRQIDALFFAITGVAIFFSLLIIVAIVYFAVKYRRGRNVDRSHAPASNVPVEVTWTVIPLAIALGIFSWASLLYLANRRVPPGALEIYVVGKQWMWKLQQPQGRWEMNQLHVPVGRPVVLTMTSEDVIHAFFVPAFRVKADVIPGTYTRLWFTPTRVGTFPLYCAEFCGTNHSKMTGTITVMEPAEYEAWLRAGAEEQQTLAAAGQQLFIRHGCSGCHSRNASVRAPLLEGLYGRPRPVQIPPAGVAQEQLAQLLPRLPATTIVADDRYIHDSIVLPLQAIAAGYQPIMPSFRGRLTEEEIFQIVAYIRSLSTALPDQGGGPAGRTPSPEEYRARTGFTPGAAASTGSTERRSR